MQSQQRSSRGRAKGKSITTGSTSQARNGSSSLGPLGTRHNQGKLRYSILSPFALRELARIGTGGEGKGGAVEYGEHNWTRGLSMAETFDSMMRHVQAMRMGERHDEKTGFLHSAHMFWNAMALCHFDVTEQLNLNDLDWGSEGKPEPKEPKRGPTVHRKRKHSRSRAVSHLHHLTGTGVVSDLTDRRNTGSSLSPGR